MEMNYASNGKANAALTTGIIGTALGALNSMGGVGGVLGGLGGGYNTAAGFGYGYDNCHHLCSENTLVNRYEASQAARIAELDTEVKLRDANIYSDQKMLELYKYVDGQFNQVRSALCEQAVHNQKMEGSFALAQADLAAVKQDLCGRIAMEAERRCCGDNAIVNYVNATFYPKLVADVTAGTTTVAQAVYNPLPDCGCCHK